MSEEWRQSLSAPGYEISDLGRVRSIKTKRLLKPHKTDKGYLRVSVMVLRRQRHMKVHRLVCEAFWGAAPSPEHEVAHYDGERANNAPDNLRWATREENWADRFRHGTDICGSKHHNAKMTEEHARLALEWKRQGMTYREIGERCGVSKWAIMDIFKGRGWRHVTIAPPSYPRSL